jgi:tetratricopeptide (TPR) repeat protein
VNVNVNVKSGRNDPCTCGSGKKYKRCCGQERGFGGAGRDAPPAQRQPAELAPPELNELLALANAGRHADVERRARALLLRLPNAGPVWSLLGLSLWMQGKDALHALERTAQLLPNDADAHGNWGTALRAGGQLGDAVKRYRRALEIRPDFAEAHNNIGSAFRDLGQLADAVTSYRQALAIKPDFAVAHCNLGHALRTLGHFDEAAKHYRRAAEIQPDFNDAHSGLGNTLQDLGQLDQAVTSHRRVLALRPDAAESHQNLGNAFLDLWRIDEAEACSRRALALDPAFAQAHNKLGVALRLKGLAAEAEASCRRALELNPDLVDALTALAQLLSDRGEFGEAEKVFKRAISVEPGSADAWAGIAGLRRMTIADAGWLAEAQRVAAAPLAPQREAKLRYAIGKYFDDVGDFEPAFTSYRRANELSKSYAATHDRQEAAREFDQIIGFFDRRWADQNRFAASTSSRPVLIVGMPRSGTTLTERILAAHPDVFGAGEVPYWVPASRKYLSTPTGDDLAATMIDRVGRDYLRLLDTKSPDALRVVDKMPANFKCLGLIHAAFPNARIIHVRRHPIDTCLSIYFQDFNATHTYANDLEDLAHYYIEYLRLMEHWRSTLPEDVILDVSYEELVEDQEAWSRKMVQFIGLPWDPRCLEFDRLGKADSTILTFSQWQARQKISKTSVARWRNYKKFVGPLRRLTEREPSS